VMCLNSPAWVRVRTPLAHGSSSSSTSGAATVAEAIEGLPDQLQEQAFLVPIRELSGGNPY
jgi:mevalonate pyrophosphate decarboxylase